LVPDQHSCVLLDERRLLSECKQLLKLGIVLN